MRKHALYNIVIYVYIISIYAEREREISGILVRGQREAVIWRMTHTMGGAMEQVSPLLFRFRVAGGAFRPCSEYIRRIAGLGHSQH